MSTNGLSPPGSSTYSSNTLHVGDGTWDSSRDDFLLPNLQGLNFATMQYNGMGNRFRGEQQYHTLVTGHAVVAAITFIGIVPAAAFIARFYTANRRVAFKLHVYLQILTVFLSTVVLILGWFAVGPDRSLSNPHHGIGIAIYTLIMFQFLYGWFMARRERKRERPHPTIPLKVYLHKLLGRAIALLAFVQIALGLTLYGSPKALFVLYALAGFFLLTLYLVLSYTTMPRLGPGGSRPPPTSDYYSDYDSYVTGQQTEYTEATGRRKDKSHWGRNVLAAAGAVGAYEWWKKGRDRKRDEKEDRYTQRPDRRQRPPRTPGGTSTYGPSAVSGGPVTPSGRTGSRPPSRGSRYSRRDSRTDLSPQTWEDFSTEKYDERPQQHTWRNRLLGAGAGIAAFEGVKSLFNRNRRQDDRRQDHGNYRPPLGGNQNMVSQSDISRVEAGQAPFSPDDHRRNQRIPESDVTQMTPSRPPARRRPSYDSMSYDDQESLAPPPRKTGAAADPTLRDSIATMGAIAGFREWSKRRRERKEDQRAERIRRQELETEEQFNRRNSDRYPRPQDASGRRHSMSGTIMTGPDPVAESNVNSSRQNFRPDPSHPPLPAAAGDFPSASGAPTSTVGPSVSRQNLAAPQQYNIPPPPPGPPPSSLRPGGYQNPEPGALQMPQGAINPDPARLFTASSPFQGSSSRLGEAAAAAAGAGAGFAASHATASQSPSRIRSREDSRVRFQHPEASSVSALPPPSNIPAGSPGSPPVSLKVKMHNDGRHVTLRRLNEEEAAAERAARRADRRQQRRNSSLSSAMDEPGAAEGGSFAAPSQRYRRGSIRPSSEQPITNIPPPPAMSNSVLGGGGGGSQRPPSDLNLPPLGGPGSSAHHLPPPPAASSRFTGSANPLSGLPSSAGGPPSQQGGFSSPPPPSISQQHPPGLVPGGSGAHVAGSVGESPGGLGGTDLGTGTDVSAFDNNRRRRRAERARRAAAQGGNRVDFT